MGKTSQPLRLLVTDAVSKWPEIIALADQGHHIEVDEHHDLANYDLILAPNAHRMTEALKVHLAAALKDVRAIKKRKGAK